jgi:hypothetical protein
LASWYIFFTFKLRKSAASSAVIISAGMRYSKITD